MDRGGVVESSCAEVTAFYPVIPGAHRRFQSRRAIFPERTNQPGLFMAVLMAWKFHAEAWVVFLLDNVALLISITHMYVWAHCPQDISAGTILVSAWDFQECLSMGM